MLNSKSFTDKMKVKKSVTKKSPWMEEAINLEAIATPPVNHVLNKPSKISKLKNQSVALVTKKQSKVKKAKVVDDITEHKTSLEKLKKIDPEFYKYLEQNDRKLLKFDALADEEAVHNEEKEDDANNAENDNDEDDDSDDVGNDERGGKLHKPIGELSVASDESDFEDDDNTARKTNSVTLKLLKEWQVELTKEKVSLDIIKNVIHAMSSALLSVSGNDASMQLAIYRVEGASAFNGVIQLCVLHLQPAIRRFLGMNQGTSIRPHKCKRWNKIKSSLRGYLIDTTKLLEHISSPNILGVLLKHLHQIIPMISSFASLTKPILKRLVSLWSSGEETVRVLSFLCILRITRDQQTQILSTVLKAMYLSYVRNSKFVSPGTLPGINFMRRSLTEMFALDLNVSYQQVFLYIRQLAIHLRNAITLKKKDSLQAVYNWQYVNSIRLWAELISTTYNKAQLQPLIFPLVSIITGAIKLIPTAQFFPLRFHLINTLIQISKETRTFIPVLPFVLEIFNSNTFNKKSLSVSMKPLQFTCILRLSKGQLAESGFRDEVIENLFVAILKYMTYESYTISYPDLVVPVLIQLKHYLKHGKNVNPNHYRKIKLLCDKLEENSQFVEKERAKFNFALKDSASINAWETSLQNKGTPLLTYFNNWLNTHISAQKRKATKSEDVNEYNLPKVLKRKSTQKEKSDGPVELFPSDDENDDFEEETLSKTKKPKKIEKLDVKSNGNVKRIDNGNGKYDERNEEEDNDEDDDDFDCEHVDIVKDLDLEDW